MLALVGTAGLVVAGLIPAIPRYESLTAQLIFVVGAPMLALLAYRAARTFLLTRRTPDVLVAVGVVLLAGRRVRPAELRT